MYVTAGNVLYNLWLYAYVHTQTLVVSGGKKQDYMVA